MPQTHAAIVIVHLWVCGFLSIAAQAADWPMYRADAGRSGYTPETLPNTMSLAWSYRAPVPRPAWPSNDRLAFDRAYQPVIAGNMLYFGSSADGKVYALDTAMGTVRWTYFTDGPVRFAPVLWKDHVFAAGDDGWLVCLNAADGKSQWRRRLAPGPEMFLGNDQMISRWPARGGPVLVDGVLYVGAGIWPSEGVMISAIDPATGKVLWCNDSSGTIEMNQPHPGARARSGVAAQGYLAVRGRDLLVPTGRAVPAVFDRGNGAFKSFPLATYAKRGGADVMVFDDQWFNHGWLFQAEENRRPQAIGVQVGVHPKWVLACKGDRLTAYDRSRLWVVKRTKDTEGDDVSTQVLAAPAWTLSLPHPAEAAMIVAGEKVILGGSNCVSLVDLGTQQVIWTGQVDGVAYGLAVAQGKLYVSTDKGLIYCFQGVPKAAPAVAGRWVATPPAEQQDAFSAAAEEILRRSGVREGYCLDLGCGDGRLTIELARRSKVRIIAVDRDPANVERLRRAVDAAGWYGWRVVVHQGDPQQLHYPRWFADLIVSGRSVAEGEAAIPAAALSRFQRPCGGVACVGKPGEMKVTSRGALQGAGQWTHQYGNAANTLCSDDALLKGPLAMLWFRDTDLVMPNRHGRGPAPLVVGGRMFVEGLDALRAVSIYNGRTLWQTPLPPILKRFHQDHLVGTAATGSNLCAGEDRIYLAHENRCTVYSMTDGSKLNEFTAPDGPDGKPGTWGFLAYDNGTLFGSLSNDKHVVSYRFLKSDMSGLWTESRVLFAMDAATGKVKWSYTGQDSIRHNAIAIGRGRVYLIDRPIAEMDGIRFPPAKKSPTTQATAGKQGENRPKPPDHQLGRLIALDSETGRPLWRRDEDVYGTLLALSAKHDVLLMSNQPGSFQLPSEKGGRMAGIRASDGTRLWDSKGKYSARPILNDRTIYAMPGAWDLLTGRSIETAMKRSYACGIAAGSRDLLVFRSATIGYIDVASPTTTVNYGGIRPGCWVNTIPAGGLMLMADSATACECSYLNQATIALQPHESP